MTTPREQLMHRVAIRIKLEYENNGYGVPRNLVRGYMQEEAENFGGAVLEYYQNCSIAAIDRFISEAYRKRVTFRYDCGNVNDDVIYAKLKPSSLPITNANSITYGSMSKVTFTVIIRGIMLAVRIWGNTMGEISSNIEMRTSNIKGDHADALGEAFKALHKLITEIQAIYKAERVDTWLNPTYK